MIPKCARLPPRPGDEPLKKSNAGANDGLIVAASRVRLNVAPALPVDLLKLADRIAEGFVARKQQRGQP